MVAQDANGNTSGNTDASVSGASTASGASAASLGKESALIALFEKMGVPLINALSAVQMWQNMEQAGTSPDEVAQAEIDKKQDVEYATNLAALLNRSVSLSTALAEKLELSPAQDQKHRLDLANVSTVMIAHHYALMAKVPEEAEVKKITSSMESVLSFVDYFSADKNLEDHDKSQEALLVECLEATVPLVHTIGRFSFGRSEKTLTSEILDDLGKRVTTLTKAFGQDLKDRSLNSYKVQIFKGCAQLLMMCYEAEMNMLIQKSSAGGRQEAAINDEAHEDALKRIWESFDSRVALLRTVLGFVNNYFTGDVNPAKAKVAAGADAPKSNAPQTPEIFSAKPATASEATQSDNKSSETPASPSAPIPGFSPIQAVLDRAEGKDPAASSGPNSWGSLEDSAGGGADAKDSGNNGDPNAQETGDAEDGSGEGGNGGGDSANPMSFFSGK